jgi:hypothetical protein
MLRVTQGSNIRNCGRCLVTGSSQRSLPASTSRASSAAVIALLFDAILNSVRGVISSPEPTMRSPAVRT